MIRVTPSPLVSSSCTLLAGGLAVGLRPAAQKHWSAYNGMGDYSNPLLCGEFEDPDMIRVGADYFRFGITEQINPAGDSASQGSGEFKLSEHGLRDAGRSMLVRWNRNIMRTNIALGLIACVMTTAIVRGQNSSDPVKPALVSSPTLGLKDAYAGKFLIGCAGEVPRRYSPEELANIKTHYNIITPENSMKPQPTHPSEDTYNFTTPDALVKWAGENNIKIWGHTLVWHAQTGRWFFQPATNGQPVTRELAMDRLRQHIMTVAGRYKGKVLGWDVVNESIADGGSGETENLRQSSWYTTIGPDVLTLAFKWAHEADPGAQLYYNDYNIEQGAVQNRGKHASSLLLLKRLIAEGAPIHGVGIQGHWHLDTNLADVEKAIENYTALGLKVSITELDVTAIGRNTGAFTTDGGSGTVTAEAFQKQAEVYRKLFEIFLKHEKSIDRVTFWGISDRRSWRSRQKALPFDDQLKPKPALQAILDVAKGGQP